LFVVDKRTGCLTNPSATVLERLGQVDGSAEEEVHAC